MGGAASDNKTVFPYCFLPCGQQAVVLAATLLLEVKDFNVFPGIRHLTALLGLHTA